MVCCIKSTLGCLLSTRLTQDWSVRVKAQQEVRENVAGKPEKDTRHVGHFDRLEHVEGQLERVPERFNGSSHGFHVQSTATVQS